MSVNKNISNIVMDLDNWSGITPLIRKIRGNPSVESRKVKIIWDDDKVDYGYTFIMPGYSGDFLWSTVVHVPNPTGEVKDPIWVSLARLTTFKKVVFVDIENEKGSETK